MASMFVDIGGRLRRDVTVRDAAGRWTPKYKALLEAMGKPLGKPGTD